MTWHSMLSGDPNTVVMKVSEQYVGKGGDINGQHYLELFLASIGVRSCRVYWHSRQPTVWNKRGNMCSQLCAMALNKTIGSTLL
jgi:hypothetical protein